VWPEFDNSEDEAFDRQHAVVWLTPATLREVFEE
jgi:hypothetical protein